MSTADIMPSTHTSIATVSGMNGVKPEPLQSPPRRAIQLRRTTGGAHEAMNAALAKKPAIAMTPTDRVG
jgi:hypothetical protein